VRCIVNPANRGAGIPDIGLFTADQFQKAADLAQRQGQLPSRGVLEAKPLSQNVNEIAASEQVKKYCAKYGLVIVTNLREFLLVAKGENGEPVPIEGFQIAPDEQAFWSTSLHPLKASRELGERFREFLARLLLHSAPFTSQAIWPGSLPPVPAMPRLRLNDRTRLHCSNCARH
jgi:hypothetical protein